MTPLCSNRIASPVTSLAAVFAVLLTVIPFYSSAGENTGSQSASKSIDLPSHLNCGKPKSPTAKSICADITSKFLECVEYNKRLSNDYDCGNDKRLLDWRSLAASAEETHVQMSKPGARIGMTKKQVIENTHWGVPRKVNSTVVPGRVSEQWVYEDGHYIYFDNGRVKAIQTSE